jgi:hypothetical protein
LRLGGGPLAVRITPLPAGRNGAQEKDAATCQGIDLKNKNFFPNRRHRRMEKIYFGPLLARAKCRRARRLAV